MTSSLVLFSTVVALLTTSFAVSAADDEAAIAAVPATTAAAAVRPRSLYRACKVDLAKFCIAKKADDDANSGPQRINMSPTAAYACLDQHASELTVDVCKAWITGRQTCIADVRPKISQCTAAVRAVAMREERAASRDTAMLQKALKRGSIEGGAAAAAVAAAAAKNANETEAGARKVLARVSNKVAAILNKTAVVRPEVLMRCLRELPESAIGAECAATDFYSSFAMFKAHRRDRSSRSREFRGKVGVKRAAETTAAAPVADVKAPVADAKAPVAAAGTTAVAAAAADDAAKASRKEKLANLIAAALDVAVDSKEGDKAKVEKKAEEETTAAALVPPVAPISAKAEDKSEAAHTEATAAEKKEGETAAAVLKAPVAPVADTPAVEKAE